MTLTAILPVSGRSKGWRRHGQVALVLVVLALPHQLRDQRWIARVEHGLRRLFVVGDEVAQFFGGHGGAPVAVGGDGRGAAG